jgi:cation:H+ antiporter
MDVEPDVITRDLPVMTALTLSLFVIGFRFKRPGRINRYAGMALLACYVGYTAFLVKATLFP